MATSPVGRVKIKRKIMKKKRKDDSIKEDAIKDDSIKEDSIKEDSPTVQIVTSTTTSTSAIFGKTIITIINLK